METVKTAEARLLSFAQRFATHNDDVIKRRPEEAPAYETEFLDTKIPSSVLPLRSVSSGKEEKDMVMHGIRIDKNKKSKERAAASTTTAPLVLVHGYMNGALYFYRNLFGLADHFETVYSLDLMGWGLSSRPQFRLDCKNNNKTNNDDDTDDSVVATAESFFVDSLEAWRERNKVDKMVLAGHSMGGYLSVAYAEKYPHRVDKLVLLSPVGVPEYDEKASREKISAYPFRTRLLFSLFRLLVFDWGVTPGDVMRTMSTSKGRQWTSSYIEKRLPAVSAKDEQEALAEYLYTCSLLPGSGEYALNKLLKAGAYAKKPTVNRIPNLKVSRVSFLYGENDWMDSNGGLETAKACQARRSTGQSAPDIDVYSIKDAGHLLMLENFEEFNSAVILAGGR